MALRDRQSMGVRLIGPIIRPTNTSGRGGHAAGYCAGDVSSMRVRVPSPWIGRSFSWMIPVNALSCAFDSWMAPSSRFHFTPSEHGGV